MPREFWASPRVGSWELYALFSLCVPGSFRKRRLVGYAGAVSGQEFIAGYKIFQDIFAIIIYIFSINKRVVRNLESVVGEQSLCEKAWYLASVRRNSGGFFIDGKRRCCSDIFV